MSGDKQIQRAGDGSQQIQGENITIINGVTEERVRAIFAEQNQLARREYTEDAYRIADERVGKFEERFMPRITEVENALPFFADPAFQYLLRRAQQSAAATEREADYDLLTELLVCHIQKGTNRKNRAGISRAISIVDEIDNDALCALTIVHTLLTFVPTTGKILDGIALYDEMFGRLMYQDLPAGSDWIDHLDMLGAMRIVPNAKVMKTTDLLPDALNGYVCVGIEMASDAFGRAMELLASANINQSILVANDLLEGYARLSIRNTKDLRFIYDRDNNLLDEVQRSTLKEIIGMYSTEAQLKKQVKEEFLILWDSFDTLKQLRLWWDNLPKGFELTQIGKVLAQTNAKRCDPALPDLI